MKYKGIVKEIESRSICDSDDVRILSEIPGIRIQTAIQSMSMIVDVNRFDSADQLCTYF